MTSPSSPLPPSPYGGPVDPSWPPPFPEEGSSRGPMDVRGLVRDLAFIVGGLAVLGVVCGVIWSQAVDPVQLTRTESGIGQGELQLSRAFNADGWFVVVGAAGGLLGGLAAGFTRRRDLVATVLLVVVGCAVAALLMRLTGEALGPADPTRMLEAAEVGDTADAPLELTGFAPYLAWPIATFLGLLVPLLAQSDDRPGART